MKVKNRVENSEVVIRLDFPYSDYLPVAVRITFVNHRIHDVEWFFAKSANDGDFQPNPKKEENFNHLEEYWDFVGFVVDEIRKHKTKWGLLSVTRDIFDEGPDPFEALDRVPTHEEYVRGHPDLAEMKELKRDDNDVLA